jgi:hypothetical protein
MALKIQNLAKEQSLAKQTLAKATPTLQKPGEPQPGIVELVTPGSPADVIGLRSGDQIVEINGIAVTGDDIPQMLMISTSPIAMTVKRGGSLLRLAPTVSRSDDKSLGFTLLGGGDTPFAHATTPETMTSRLRKFLGAGGGIAGVRG